MLSGITTNGAANPYPDETKVWKSVKKIAWSPHRAELALSPLPKAKKDK
jgi:hypothetical protein